MTLSRRGILQIGGAFLAGLPLSTASVAQSGVVEIVMRGNSDGSMVWFEPAGVLIRPGATVRWINRDVGNSHTSTAYHPDNDGHPLRVPPGAQPWNSDYLLPDESFESVFDAPGVYDYFCIPHEHAGMVGRLVVMREGQEPPVAVRGSPVDGIDQDPFPTVNDIIRRGQVRL